MSVVRSLLGWIVPAAILAAGIAAFLLMGDQPPPQRVEAPVAAAVPVRTVEAERVADGLTIEADGVVVPLREVTLAAEVGGRIVRKTDDCRAGRFVKAGTPLFEIDPRDYELDVARLEREVAQAELSIAEVDAELTQNEALVDLARRQVTLARREVTRLEGLKAGRIVTESEHDRAVREELTASNAVTTLEGQNRMLLARRNRLVEGRRLAITMLDKAKLDLSRTRIVAPADGIIADDRVEQESFVAKGTPLVTIEDTSAAEVRTSLEMADVARIWGARRGDDDDAGRGHEQLDTPATVVFTIDDAVYAWDGVLSRQEGRGLDEKTRTLPCRVRVADPRGVRAIDRYGAPMPRLPPEAPRALLRGMFVTVRVHVDPGQDLVSVPEEAQRPNGEVWVVRDGRLVVLRPRAVQAAGGRVVFDAATSGIAAGDRVVTSQVSNPRSGMPVSEAAADQPRTAATKDGGDAT